ncbi:flagellar basal body rod protein FlgB [Devosia sp. ZB163]|uniref:flagellar basal body rod protein FlgB n=1 Tax=Devosia sp. ZB163 TaxID=3025938 RepID=UPI002361DF07|nr:flagellar basal body rod protein FlgB [Devosia sp. ZB163]MDC9824424.1 flagellar basal body rod protein FlgB [Devosia sp. ZB163]
MKLGLLDAISEKMRWHQTRQTLLAENVANADTPGYRGRDLKAFGFEEHMKMRSRVEVATVATQPGHISVRGTGPDGFGARDLNSFEITPEGNGVTLEDEMMKVAGNQLDYQSITALYTRSVKLLKTALGKQA